MRDSRKKIFTKYISFGTIIALEYIYIYISRQNRLLKGESFDGRDSFRGAVLRPSVSKSFSFGGYTKGMLTRGDSVTSTHSAGARLMKQGSYSQWRTRLQ